MRTVDRAIAVLEAFTPDSPNLMLHEVAERIALSQATTFRLLNALVDSGYLLRQPDLRYCLSLKVLRFAHGIGAVVGISDLAATAMRRLASRTGETVSLYVRDGDERVCIDVIGSPHRLASVVHVGDRSRLGIGASAKVLLAYLPGPERRRQVERFARAAGFDKATLTADLDAIREAGIAVTQNETVLGNAGVAAPIFDRHGSAGHAIALSCPTVRFTAERRQTFVELVGAAGREISARNGWAG